MGASQGVGCAACGHGAGGRGVGGGGSVETRCPLHRRDDATTRGCMRLAKKRENEAPTEGQRDRGRRDRCKGERARAVDDKSRRWGDATRQRADSTARVCACVTVCACDQRKMFTQESGVRRHQPGLIAS